MPVKSQMAWTRGAHSFVDVENGRGGVDLLPGRGLHLLGVEADAEVQREHVGDGPAVLEVVAVRPGVRRRRRDAGEVRVLHAGVHAVAVGVDRGAPVARPARGRARGVRVEVAVGAEELDRVAARADRGAGRGGQAAGANRRAARVVAVIGVGGVVDLDTALELVLAGEVEESGEGRAARVAVVLRGVVVAEPARGVVQHPAAAGDGAVDVDEVRQVLLGAPAVGRRVQVGEGRPALARVADRRVALRRIEPAAVDLEEEVLVGELAGVVQGRVRGVRVQVWFSELVLPFAPAMARP